MKKFRLLKNAALLTVTGFILRALGMLLRIFISARIGEEGMGVYQLITSVYFLFITLAVSGVPVALTRFVSGHLALGDTAAADRALKSSLKLSLISGILSSAIMLALSDMICRLWICDGRALLSLRTLAFSLPFIAVCNVLSAYFIATKNVINGCTSQILEQVVRIGISAVVIFKTADCSMSFRLCMLFLANTLSESVACGYLWIRYSLFTDKPYAVTRTPSQMKGIIRYATPVALSKYLACALRTAENMLVPSAIAMYTLNRSDALAQFGALKGMAIPLLFFPSSFLGAISTLLLPEMTEAQARGDRTSLKRITSRVCSVTIILSVMLGGAFFMFAKELGMLIYKSETVCEILLWLSPIVPFMYLDTVCDGLLKGLGLQKRTLLHNCIDSGIRILLIAVLVPRYGLHGFLFVMVISNILICTLNTSLLIKRTNVIFDIKGWIMLPVLFVLASATVTKFLSKNCATMPKTVLGITVFCLVFLVFEMFYQKNKKV